jgi:CheY-like chemotaxis protein
VSSRPPSFFIHVLVVDDDDGQRENLRTVLANEGYKVDVASDGVDAVRKFVALNPDVVLMDLSMPVMNGGTRYARSAGEETSADPTSSR